MNMYIGGYVQRIKDALPRKVEKEFWAECASWHDVTVRQALQPTEATSGTRMWLIGLGADPLLEQLEIEMRS